MKNLPVLFICVILQAPSLQLAGQLNNANQHIHSRHPENFQDWQAAMNEYFAMNPDVKGQNPFRRKEWFYEQRLAPSGEFFDIASHTQGVLRRYLRNQPQQRSTHGGWLFIGPLDWSPGPGSNFGLGRINSIDFHPSDTNTLYVTTPNAGVWKTTNGGSTWTNITPNIPFLSAIDLEIDHDNPDNIYVLTGDGDPTVWEMISHSQTEVSSAGIIKSNDGGATWYPTGMNFAIPSGKIPTKLLMHPDNPLIQFACFQNAIYKTVDAWANYTTVSSLWTFDIEFHPSNPDIMYASGRNNFRKSINAGATWSTITDPDFSILPTTVRLEIAVTPDIPDMVYLIGNGWDTISRIALFQSLDSGNSNTWVVKDTVSDLIGPFGEYATAMTVRPDNFATIIAGGINFFRSTTQGTPGSWTVVGYPPVHVDCHELRYNNTTLYAATDGGLWRSYNNGDDWTDLTPGLAITEVYRISGTPQNTNKYIVGAQDTGHKMRTAANTTFKQIGGADGMVSIIDYLDEDIIYIAGQYGGINKSTDGGNSFNPTNNPGNNGAWITPYIMDPVDPDIIFVGKDSIHRSFNGGTTWQLIDGPMTTGQNLNNMAQGTDDRNTMYVSFSSTTEFHIWRSENVLDIFNPVSWTEITAGLPTLFISDIIVDPNDASTLYVTLSGYGDGLKVYKNTTGNANSWQNISGSLPNVPVNCIEFHDNGQDGLYVGTDIGVFYRDNTLTDWIYFSNFLPSVVVLDLYLNPTNNTIAAGTYGRGLWLSDTYSSCNVDVTINSTATHGGTLYYAASNAITSTNFYNPDLGTDIHYKAGNYIDLKPGFLLGGLGYFEGRIGGCPNDLPEPLSEHFYPTGILTSYEEGPLIHNKSN